MYDYSKLLGIMKEKNITQESLAKSIGISETSLNKKLKNNSQFKQDEMISILNILGVNVNNVANIFFSH
ncbi:MAG: DUF739 family protein [Acutalibacteraceae bacterium]